MELRGLCLCPWPLCQFILAKGKGAHGSLKINPTLSRGCLTKVKYSYTVVAESSPSSPCSNAPVSCSSFLLQFLASVPSVQRVIPAVWKYFLKVHFQDKHKMAPLTRYKHLWKLSFKLRGIRDEEGLVKTNEHIHQTDKEVKAPTADCVRRSPCANSFKVWSIFH
jgi:hypothetical protein